MKYGLFFSIVLISLFIVGLAEADNVKVKLINKTDWEIHEMYLSPTKQKDWGEDQLGDEVIEKNSSFELKGIPVGKYDFKIVDEDSDECVVEGIKIAADEDVKLTNDLLIGCQANTESEDE